MISELLEDLEDIDYCFGKEYEQTTYEQHKITNKEQRVFLRRIGIDPRDFFTNRHKYKKGSRKLKLLPKRKRYLVASATYNGS